MITIHHLGMSRSDRIIWLAEDLGIDYSIVKHHRGADFRAPQSLWDVHPMGKAPIIEDDGKRIFESGAIVEYLIDRYGNGKLKPDTSSQEYLDYLHWMHCAESTLMTPIFIGFLTGAMGVESEALRGFVAGEYKTLFTYMNAQLERHDYIAGNTFTGADVMVAYPLLMAQGQQPPPFADYPAISAYMARLQDRPAYIRAAASF
jgi:glutathione S-transferase